jgi:uncharacterized membrane-anchored protein
VGLKPGQGGIYAFDGASPNKPPSGTFIRGRLEAVRWDERKSGVRYGIEAYFAPNKKALELEKELRKSGVATVMIAANGKATLKDVASY